MPIDNRFLTYIAPLTELLLPCEPIETILENSRIVVIATKKPGAILTCPCCGKVGSPRGLAQPRLIRHLDFENMPVWVNVTFPRVYCPEHGHVVAKQNFCKPRCRISKAFEDLLLEMICGTDQTEMELKKQFQLKGQALARIVDRARQQLEKSTVDGFQTVDKEMKD
jgi:transposase